MSDLEKYIAQRKKTDSEFAQGYDKGYENFKADVLLKIRKKDKYSVIKQQVNEGTASATASAALDSSSRWSSE